MPTLPPLLFLSSLPRELRGMMEGFSFFYILEIIVMSSLGRYIESDSPFFLPVLSVSLRDSRVLLSSLDEVSLLVSGGP